MGSSDGSWERLNAPPALEHWEIRTDGTHPPKCPLHEGASGWQFYCFPALCSQTPRATRQVYGGIDQTLWLGFVPCRTITITQPSLIISEKKSINRCIHALYCIYCWNTVYVYKTRKLQIIQRKDIALQNLSQPVTTWGWLSPLTWGLHPLTAAEWLLLYPSIGVGRPNSPKTKTRH